MKKPHNHFCTDCNHTWHHDPRTIPVELHHEAHCCPVCGKPQYEVDDMGTVPQFCSNGVRCIKLDGSGDTFKCAPALPESTPDIDYILNLASTIHLYNRVSKVIRYPETF